MALDLNCRECQAGLAQVGQMALGFHCFDHGTIGIEISELMKIATAPLVAQARKDALLEAAKLVCAYCARGNQAELRPNSVEGFWHSYRDVRSVKKYDYCLADNIWRELTVKAEGTTNTPI